MNSMWVDARRRGRRHNGRSGAVFAIVVSLGAVALAEPQPVKSTPTVTRQRATQARFQIRVMEGVLEQAVQHGAEVVSAQLRQVSPDLMVFSGPVRARGFLLDGYGLFFSVDVPAVRRSVTWSFKTLRQNGLELTRAMQSLRRYVQDADGRTRTELEQALKLVELQVGPLPAGAPASPGMAASATGARNVSTARTTESVVGTTAAEVEPVVDTPSAVIDPDAAYETEVKRALIDAMLDYGAPLSLGADEWLTIAARDTDQDTMAGEITNTVTIVLKVKGSDLADFHAGRLTRELARERVTVSEF